MSVCVRLWSSRVRHAHWCRSCGRWIICYSPYTILTQQGQDSFLGGGEVRGFFRKIANGGGHTCVSVYACKC